MEFAVWNKLDIEDEVKTQHLKVEQVKNIFEKLQMKMLIFRFF